MKHFRILEAKGKNKYYIIQYINKSFLGLYIWKKFNHKKYSKYDDALTEIKNNISYSDYESSLYKYHYIDAYKILKSKNTYK